MEPFTINVTDGHLVGSNLHGDGHFLVSGEPCKMTKDGILFPILDENYNELLVANNSDVFPVDISQQTLDSYLSNIDSSVMLTDACNETENVSDVIMRIQKRFTILREMATAAAQGIVRGLVVYAPHGVGKTHNIEQALKREQQAGDIEFEIVKGYMRTPHLFIKLWENRHSTNVLVFDDCDSVLNDLDSLMLLKTALDTTHDRILSYGAQSPVLKEYGAPKKFNFEGSVIFVTNTDFVNNNSPKLKDHLAAIAGRCHYLDLTIDSNEEKLLWIKHITLTSDILSKRGISLDTAKELLQFVEDNLGRMNDLSLRIIVKIAELIQINPDTWQEKAQHTVMERK